MLQRSGLRVGGAWMPYWIYDVVCLERSVAEEAGSRFSLDLREVGWPKMPGGDAFQIVIPTVGGSWFDTDELRDSVVAEHGSAGKKCSVCGVWRWFPVSFGESFPVRIVPGLGGVDIAASPEWFGDGWSAFRQFVVRRGLAELIVASSPRDFKIMELPLP
jgi:hypothetical protein